MVFVLQTNLTQKCCNKTSVTASVIIFVLLVSVYQEDNVKESDKHGDIYSEEAGEQRRGPLVYRGETGQTGVSVNRCRSLFTITGVPNEKTLFAAHLLQYSADNSSLLSDRWTPLHQRGDQHLSAAVKEVKHLLQKRSSSSGASTEDYRSLAALLPTLLTFQHHTNKSQEDDHRKEGQTPILHLNSRIDVNGGVLPYVPCAIVPFDHPPSVTACFAHRLKNNNSFWIAFLGDSKIRALFYEYLQRTDSEYRYLIHLLNTTMSYEEMRRTTFKLHTDMEAATPVHPRLRVSFRTFMEVTPSKVQETKELRQLSRWARGEDPLPHILIIGYTSWMILHMSYTSDVMEVVREMHQQVVPLLHQIAQRTRVLVVSQGRYREHSLTGTLYNKASLLGDATFDWSEMLFQYYLRQYKDHHLSPDTPHVSYSFTTPITGSLQQHFPVPQGPTTNTVRPKTTRTNRDHLDPRVTGGGVWWWDTGVPLNLAGISECEELYRRGLVDSSVYTSEHLGCTDNHHVGEDVLSDQITMLLNLMCNSIMQQHTNVCCH
ncbi:uncharacterized protein LOC121874791 isoform X2 [Homarus americanus]|uniref:Uncharacterized protein n=1 Tax=Homarus americanus TaxID=6706 RepID=A0A8J5MSF5_HOMAM|nr:uncharacterized protein LOC121874791 isoform X2 [Homarus americanus]KAG7161661.1 hypothetical protein Hamer_G026662 [Homarus americanus]